MSNPMMNHNSHLQEVADQQQHQHQQQTTTQLIPSQNQHSSSIISNLDTPTTMNLTRSDSTSTVILEEEEKRVPARRKDLRTLPPSALANFSLSLRSLLKTSGLFNEKSGSFDKLNDLFASGNEFTLQRLLSEVGNEIQLDMTDLLKFDSVKMLDSRTLSDFIRSESFDQLLATAIQNNDISSTPPALPCSSSSFSELRPVSPELITPDMFAGQNKMDTTNPMIYTQMTSAESSNASSEMNQTTLNAVDHDHAFLYKRLPTEDESPSSSSSAVVKASRRTTGTSSRTQNRPTSSSNKSKRSKNVSRAKDIQSSDDLSYYLERRRKNNEASKVSRAVRKQRFDEMDTKCAEYERVNEELRKKISTLETVTKNLKSGLITNFQRK